MRKSLLGHILLIGPSGSGKKTLARAIGYELKTSVRLVTLNELHSPGAVCAVLTSIHDGDVLIIENFDMIQPECLELLYTAMKNFSLEFNIGKGTAARQFQLDLPPFTLIAISDKNKSVPTKIKECFYLNISLSNYTTDELIQLAKKWCDFNGVDIINNASEKLSIYADGSNKKLVYALKRARDFSMVINNKVIDLCVAEKTVDSLVNNDLS